MIASHTNEMTAREMYKLLKDREMSSESSESPKRKEIKR